MSGGKLGLVGVCGDRHRYRYRMVQADFEGTKQRDTLKFLEIWCERGSPGVTTVMKGVLPAISDYSSVLGRRGTVSTIYYAENRTRFVFSFAVPIGSGRFFFMEPCVSSIAAKTCHNIQRQPLAHAALAFKVPAKWCENKGLLMCGRYHRTKIKY